MSLCRPEPLHRLRCKSLLGLCFESLCSVVCTTATLCGALRHAVVYRSVVCTTATLCGALRHAVVHHSVV